VAKVRPPFEVKFVATNILTVTGLVPSGLTVLGLKEHPEAGMPEQLKLTLPWKPFNGVTVIGMVTICPAVVVTAVGLAVSVKLAVAPPPPPALVPQLPLARLP